MAAQGTYLVTTMTVPKTWLAFASEASNFVNGHILYVDGGVTATL